MTQYGRYGSAKGTTWAYWERIKSVWKRLRQIKFQECGVRHTWGASKKRPRAWQKMMQWPRCTPVPELKQDIVWNTPLLSCSWKPPRYGGRSDIMFLKPNWYPLRGLSYAHLTSTLRCHWDCGAHDHVQCVVPMLSIASQCIHVTIPLPLNLFHPVTFFSSERRLAAQSALVLSLLREAPRFCA